MKNSLKKNAGRLHLCAQEANPCQTNWFSQVSTSEPSHMDWAHSVMELLVVQPHEEGHTHTRMHACIYVQHNLGVCCK